MQTKRQILSTIISILVSVFLVAGATWAVTTVGNNVTVGGALGVTGATTLSSTLSVTATSTFTGNIVLQNSETIDNATDGTVNVTGKLKVTAAGMTENEKAFEVSASTNDAIKGVRQGAIAIGLTRASTNALTAWDGNPDAGLKISVANRAANTTSRGGVRGIDVNARNRDNGTLSWINAIYATAEHSDGTADSATVAQFIMKNNGVINTSHYGVVIQDTSQGSGPADTTLLKLTTGTINPATGARASAMQIKNADTAGFTYGIDMNSATIGTADIRLSSGVVIKTGAGAPSGACTEGSLYLRTDCQDDGTQCLYVCAVSGTWVDLK